jgi:hypothetical protein
VPNPYCGSRIVTKIARVGSTRPGVEYYECQLYSVIN